jgi:hypothetical protein
VTDYILHFKPTISQRGLADAIPDDAERAEVVQAAYVQHRLTLRKAVREGTLPVAVGQKSDHLIGVTIDEDGHSAAYGVGMASEIVAVDGVHVTVHTEALSAALYAGVTVVANTPVLLALAMTRKDGKP